MSFFVEYSARFLNADLEQIPDEITIALERFRQVTGCGRCTLGRLKQDYRSADYVCTATAPGIETFELSGMPATIFEKYLSRVLRRQIIVLTPEQDMSAEELRFLAGVHSHIIVPLSVQGTVWGTLSASHYDSDRQWRDEVKKQARIFGELLASTLERHRFMTELSTQSARLAHLSRRLLHHREEERRALARDLHDDFPRDWRCCRLSRAICSIN